MIDLQKNPDGKYPEHQKLKAVQQHSQVIGEFLEWLSSEEQGYTLCAFDQNKGDEGQYFPANLNLNVTLAQFFKIDLNKIEQERCQMLDELRDANQIREEQHD